MHDNNLLRSMKNMLVSVGICLLAAERRWEQKLYLQMYMLLSIPAGVFLHDTGYIPKMTIN